MLKQILSKLIGGEHLTRDEAVAAMNIIMEGQATPAQIGSFLTALRMKGESIDEITGCAMVMRQKALKIHPSVDYCIDTCGTGGDHSGTFNISTAAAFVAGAAGVKVAKHGNRSVSSRSGSADVLEELGVKIDVSPEKVKECIEEIGIGFMFAPAFHSAMKHALGPRRELGARTIFNILGPLTNPAEVKGQIMGVFDEELTEPLAKVLLNLGVERAMVVHGMDGLDEITLTDKTKVSEVKDGKIVTYSIDPEQYGYQRVSPAILKGADARVNADIIRRVFMGEKGPRRDIVEFNSAASLYVGKKAVSLEEGIEIAREIIDGGLALRKLKELSQKTSLAA